MSAKEQILARIRAALSDVDTQTEDEVIVHQYGQSTPMTDVIERFVERVEDYRATVVRCDLAEVARQIVAGLQETGAQTVVIPDDAPEGWSSAARQAGLEVVGDDPQLSAQQLDGIDAVVTGCSVGVAETGTIILDHGPDQGRRALSLLPDRHIVIVRADQVVSDVPEAVTAMTESMTQGRPQTWISGPSATSDIELDRVEGVHGPRQLWVIVAQ